MNFETLPIFPSLPPDQRTTIMSLTRLRHVAAGDALFYEGDPASELILLISGQVALTHAAQPRGVAHPGQFLDPAAVLGGLPHTVRASAVQACEVLCWAVDDLKRRPAFHEVASHCLGMLLQQTETRLAEATAPIHYTGLARIAPGPYLFDHATLLIAFCEADRAAITAVLPQGLSLLALSGGPRAPIFLGLADFPDAHPEHNPDARFAYRETACFVPVQHGTTPGVFIPYIYPSSWEPILIGREVYGFPKRLGQTAFNSNEALLVVDGQEQFRLQWDGLETSGEARLVGALMGWLGIQRHLASAAFQVGDTLRLAMGLPGNRRVDVFNHKQILSVDATHADTQYVVDHLTHAVFGVLRWFSISKMQNPRLSVVGGPLAGANLALREAYRTQLDMRLSTGQVIGK